MTFEAQPISKKVTHFSAYQKYGCPICLTGETSATTLIQSSGCALVRCSNCGNAYLICADDLDTIPDQIASNYETLVIPRHPLEIADSAQ